MSPSVLTRDPVFQVNACLWLVLRPDGGQADSSSSYGRSGFVVRALGKKLGVSPAVRVAFKAASLSPDPPKPDVILRNATHGHHLVLECKASGFTPSSSTAKQARKFLIACADADNALGSPGQAFVVYVTADEDAGWLLQTLGKLRAEIVAIELDPAPAGVIGLSIDGEGLWATLDLEDAASISTLAEVHGRRLIVAGGNDEARPIYILPFDPAAAENQDPAELDYCLRMLTERVVTYCMHVVGLASVPDCLYIDADDALKQATFNLSTRWRDGGDVDSLRNRIASIIFTTLNRGDLKGHVERVGTVVSVNLDSKDDQDVALNLLFKVQSSKLADELADRQESIVDFGL